MTQSTKNKIGGWGLKIAGFFIIGILILKLYQDTLVFSWGIFISVLLAVFFIINPRGILTLVNRVVNKYIINKFKSK